MPRHFRALMTLGLAALFIFVSCASFAQTDSPAAPKFTAPSFTAASLEADAEAVQGNDALSVEQKAEITATLNSAAENLQKAAESLADKKRFQSETEMARETLGELSELIETEQMELLVETVEEGEDLKEAEGEGDLMREEDLLQLEQDLITRESELQAARAEVDGYDSGLETLSSRQGLAPTELTDARTSLGQIAISLAALGEDELDALGDAQRKNLRARQYFRNVQIEALQQEIPSLSVRQEIVTARRNLADIRVQKLSQQVQYLQNKTGQKRLNDAGEVKVEAEAIAEDYANFHPIVGDYATENIAISEEIVELAKNAAELSKSSANIVSRQDLVKSDLRIAEDLIQSGSLDRLAGETLRRLSNQLLPPNVIQSQIDATQKRGIAVTQKKLITQDRLRSMPPGRTDVDTAYALAKTLNPNMTPLTEADRRAYSDLYRQRREYLTRVFALTTTQNTEIFDFQAQQKQLLTDTVTLRNLLDEKLLWVPSVPAINLQWPSKVVKGAGEVFTGANLKNSVGVFASQFRQRLLLVFSAGIFVFGIMRLRKLVWANVKMRAAMVGRVRDDSAWHTPITVLAGMFMALPFPLIFGAIGGVLDLSGSTDPFIIGLTKGFYGLAVLSFIFMTWLTWDRDNSLFGTHFELPTGIRCAVFSNLKWFLPVIGVLTLLLILSLQYSSENIYGGFSLFIFILTAISLSVFGALIFYRDKKIMDNLFIENATLHSFRKVIVGGAVAFPILTAIFAAIGYYASAYELLYRAFLTGGILLLAYVVSGVIKRAITVAQRLIKYRQAMERREAELKSRAEKIKAEQLGEDAPPPPPIDTEAIDVSSMTRQSLQLMNTIVGLGLVLLLWMNWSSLMPALTIFDGFELGTIDTGLLDDDGRKITRTITLWTFFRASLVFILTIIAAKNFPSFIEIFALSRVGVDSGVRYAIKTIMGYLIIAFGVIWTFNILGLQWSQLRWVVTGLSVGIGFGLQKIIANFISGLIILFERPVRIGDYVTIGDQSGTVNQIKIRATTLNDLDNREILIPNEALISERVINWTLSSSITRLIVPVGIAYGSDTDMARDLMLNTIKAHPKVLAAPAPQVLFMGFGDSSLDFEIRVFLNSFEDRVPMRHVVHTEIYKALEAAGISIPFPQTDLNIVSQSMPFEVKSGKSNAEKNKTKPRVKSSAKSSKTKASKPKI